jgi:hypothetical protein
LLGDPSLLTVKSGERLRTLHDVAEVSTASASNPGENELRSPIQREAGMGIWSGRSFKSRPFHSAMTITSPFPISPEARASEMG